MQRSSANQHPWSKTVTVHPCGCNQQLVVNNPLSTESRIGARNRHNVLDFVFILPQLLSFYSCFPPPHLISFLNYYSHNTVTAGCQYSHRFMSINLNKKCFIHFVIIPLTCWAIVVVSEVPLQVQASESLSTRLVETQDLFPIQSPSRNQLIWPHSTLFHLNPSPFHR